MKIFQNKKIFNKIVIVLVLLTVFSFCFSGSKVKAKDDSFGGKLLKPIVDFFVFLGDGTMGIIHKIIYNYGESTISVDMVNGILGTILSVIVGIGVAVIVAAAVVFTGGAIIAALPAVVASFVSIGLGTVVFVSVGSGVAAALFFNSNVLPDTIQLPTYLISPDKIFSNEVALFDVDFFNPSKDFELKDGSGNPVKDEQGNPIVLESTAKNLRGVISNWYRILRDISLVALLSVLVYIGIRIIISSASNDKAKYKSMLVDWIVAICLLFAMQYIMAFSNLIVGKITDVIKTTRPTQGYTAQIADEKGKIKEKLEKEGVTAEFVENEGKQYVVWQTDLMGVARLNSQMNVKNSAMYAGYTLIFVALVILTVCFIFTYLKRVLYMAFLTMIAPLVAMTYPIDKINDGKAQAFNMWFKEYIFNLLIQPMHLILYTVLITSAFELASKNMIYAIVALFFMMPAEKLVRKFFGFEKAQTPGLLAGPAGTALIMSGLKALGKPPKSHAKTGGNSKKSTGAEGDEGRPPRMDPNFDKDDALFGGGDAPTIDDGSNDPNIDNGMPSGNNNDDNIYDLSEDEYSIRDADTPPLLGLPMNDNPSGSSGPRGNSNNADRINNDDNIRFNTNNDSDDIEVIDSGVNIPRNSSQNSGEKEKNRKVLRNPFRGIPAATKYYARQTKENLKEDIKENLANAHPIRTVGGIASEVLGATMFGAAALAGSVTDPSKIGQNVALGAGIGAKFAGGIVDNADRYDSLTPEGYKEVADRAGYKSDDDYKQAKQEKYVKDYKKNAKNRFELERNFGSTESKRILNEDMGTFLDNGVTDIKDIVTIEKMVQDKKLGKIEEGIATRKYAKKTGDTTDMTAKKRAEWKATFAQDFGKKEKFKDQDHNKMADSVLDRIDAYYNTKKKI